MMNRFLFSTFKFVSSERLNKSDEDNYFTLENGEWNEKPKWLANNTYLSTWANNSRYSHVRFPRLNASPNAWGKKMRNNLSEHFWTIVNNGFGWILPSRDPDEGLTCELSCALLVVDLCFVSYDIPMDIRSGNQGIHEHDEIDGSLLPAGISFMSELTSNGVLVQHALHHGRDSESSANRRFIDVEKWEFR